MGTSGRATVVLMPGQGRVIDIDEDLAVTVKASEQDTDGAFSLVETKEASGVGPPLHIHHDADESFFVLEGEYRIIVEDQVWLCPVGSFVLIRSGMTHTFQATARSSRKLNLYTPAAMVGYFDELASAVGREAATPEAISAIADRYAMQVVGPIPKRYV